MVSYISECVYILQTEFVQTTNELYGTVCLLTSLTLHHKLSLETASKHFYSTKPSLAAQLTSPAVKRL